MGATKKEIFGTGLTGREQKALVDAINRIIASAAVPVRAVRQPNGMLEEVPPPLGLNELQHVPRIVVEEASSDRLCYRRRIYSGGWEMYAFLFTQLLTFTFVEMTLHQANAAGAGWQGILFTIVLPPFEVLFLLGIAFCLFGTLKIELTADWIVAEWGFRPVSTAASPGDRTGLADRRSIFGYSPAPVRGRFLRRRPRDRPLPSVWLWRAWLR